MDLKNRIKENSKKESNEIEVSSVHEEKSAEKKPPFITKLSLLFCSARKGIIRTVGSIAAWFHKLHRETKGVMLVASGIGVLLCIAVILLGVRLAGVTNELKSVQALSMNLQEELTRTQTVQNQIQLLPEEKEVYDRNAVKATPTEIPTPIPTVQPTATPEPEKYIVCVDAGHGDWDGGAVLRENGVEKRIEKDDNLWLSKLFRDALKEYGIEVIMTRETDVYLGLTERTDIANAANADALISFHRNSFDGESDVSGIEFWIHSSRPEGASTLAQSMLDAVMKVGGMENRGVKSGAMSGAKDNYSINRFANMTSMIIEFGFVTSRSDNAAYDANGEAYAKEMAKAVYEWLETRETAE